MRNLITPINKKKKKRNPKRKKEKETKREREREKKSLFQKHIYLPSIISTLYTVIFNDHYPTSGATGPIIFLER